MKRYPAFDPPEYVDWGPDSALVRSFAERINGDPDRSRSPRRSASADRRRRGTSGPGEREGGLA